MSKRDEMFVFAQLILSKERKTTAQSMAVQTCTRFIKMMTNVFLQIVTQKLKQKLNQLNEEEEERKTIELVPKMFEKQKTEEDEYR